MEPTEQSTPNQPITKKRPHIILLVVLLTIVATAAAYVALSVTDKRGNNQSSTQNESSKTASIEINATGFEPATLKISAGTTITWVNIDEAPHRIAADPHPSHESLPELDSQEALSNGDSYSFTFNNSGSVQYHDHLNPMHKGVIIVE